jgi:hypothetical protein
MLLKSLVDITALVIVLLGIAALAVWMFVPGK